MDDARARARLYARLQEILGDEEAGTLMGALPYQPPPELVTKADLAQALENLEHKLLATMRQEFVAQTRTFVLATMGSTITMGSIAIAIAVGR